MALPAARQTPNPRVERNVVTTVGSSPAGFEPTYRNLALDVGRRKHQRRGNDKGLGQYNTTRPAQCRPRMPESGVRPEEHRTELHSLMRIPYAVFCLKKKKRNNTQITRTKREKY